MLNVFDNYENVYFEIKNITSDKDVKFEIRIKIFNIVTPDDLANIYNELYDLFYASTYLPDSIIWKLIPSTKIGKGGFEFNSIPSLGISISKKNCIDEVEYGIEVQFEYVTELVLCLALKYLATPNKAFDFTPKQLKILGLIRVMVNEDQDLLNILPLINPEEFRDVFTQC